MRPQAFLGWQEINVICLDGFCSGLLRSVLRTTAEHEGNATLPEAIPPRVSRPTTPHNWHLEQRCPHWLEQGHCIGKGPTTCIVRNRAKSFHSNPENWLDLLFAR
jgi:hypothetical protein